MRVNIVVGNADLGWIAGRFARELVARMPRYGVDATINGRDADIEYQQIVYGAPTSHPAVGLFTHGSDRPKWFASMYEGHIALNSASHQFLMVSGAPDPVMIPFAVDDKFIADRPKVFGVAGHVHADKRKGEHLVVKMMEAGYDVRAWGAGWPCPIVSDLLEDVLPFYESIDYFVDTDTSEGGCVPAAECLALGIPVIGHKVGVERPVYEYECGSWPSLQRVLKHLTQPWTYDDWAREHASYFKRVMKRA